MSDSPTTRASLLLRLRDARDARAWGEFVEVYGPLVYRFARKHSLQDADAADLTQDILRAFAGHAAEFSYDPNRGSFRGWLFTVARNKLRNFLASPRRREQGAGDTQAQVRLANVAADDGEQEEWDREYQQRVFAWAADRVRKTVQDTTWQAFWRTAVEAQPGQKVAADLGLSVAAVYLAKSRVMARLKEQIAQLEPESC
jgi:RNA polymerase sigma-70 factor (ECF subfamily)